jgi:hypothetical protein
MQVIRQAPQHHVQTVMFFTIIISGFSVAFSMFSGHNRIASNQKSSPDTSPRFGTRQSVDSLRAFLPFLTYL